MTTHCKLSEVMVPNSAHDHLSYFSISFSSVCVFCCAGQHGQCYTAQGRGRVGVLVLFPSPHFTLWAALLSSSSFGWCCFSPTFFGKVLLSALLPWLALLFSFLLGGCLSFSPSLWGWSCCGAFRFVCFPIFFMFVFFFQLSFF